MISCARRSSIFIAPDQDLFPDLVCEFSLFIFDTNIDISVSHSMYSLSNYVKYMFLLQGTCSWMASY